MFKRIKRFKRSKRAATSSYIFELTDEIESTQNNTAPHVKTEEISAAERTLYLFPAMIKKTGGNKWGYINAKGNIILPPVYGNAGDFSDNGLAIVSLNGKYGVINYNGYFIVKPKYNAIHPFREGRAIVADNQGFKVIDESGKELTSKIYSFIGDYQEGRALFADKNERGNYLYGFLNKRGKEVLQPAYEMAGNFNDGKTIVKIAGGSYALISLTGKVLRTYSYFFVGNYSEGMLAFQKKAGDNFGYMDEQGNTIITPMYTETQPFRDRRAIVKVNNRFGLIDGKGQYIFKPNYHNMVHLGEGRIAIGKLLVPEKPAMGTMYAVADTEGHIFTGFIFNSITRFVGGNASASNDKAVFFIDKNGNRINDLPTVDGRGELHIDKNLIKAEIDERLFYFEKNGTLVWQQNAQIPLNEQYSVLESKYKPNKDFLIYYPQLDGLTDKKTLAKINQTLKDLAGVKETLPQLQLEANYTGDFDIPFYKSDLVVSGITGCNDYLGGAHDRPVKKYVHIDLKTGEVFHLVNLFKPGSQYVKAISEIISNQIKYNRDYSYVFPGSYKGIQADQPFFISKCHLNIYFSPNEIAPYAAGFPTFQIPFEELSMILDQNGAFWRAFN